MKASPLFGHAPLTLVHIGDDVQASQSGVCDLSLDQHIGDDAMHLSPGLQRRVRDVAHQPHPAPAEDDADPFVGQVRPQPAHFPLVTEVCSGGRSGEQRQMGDFAHGAILSGRFCKTDGDVDTEEDR